MRYLVTTTYADGKISEGVTYERNAAEYFAAQCRVTVRDGVPAVEVTVTAEEFRFPWAVTA
jgi:hypothetical protein